MLRLSVTAPVDSVGAVYHAVSDCQRLSEEFTVGGSIVLRVAVELGQVSQAENPFTPLYTAVLHVQNPDFSKWFLGGTFCRCRLLDFLSYQLSYTGLFHNAARGRFNLQG